MKLTALGIQHLSAPLKGQRIHFDDALKGFGIRCSQGGAKTWVLVQGKARKLTTLGRYPSVTLQDARKRAVIALETSKAPDAPSGSSSFQSVATAFLEAKRRITKPATVYQYEMYLDRMTWTKPIGELTRKEIYEHLAQYEDKPTSQNYAFGTLRTLLNWAMQEDLLNKHPLFRARVPNTLKSRERVLTDDEIKMVWLATDYKPYGYFVRLLLLSGQRKMEIYKNPTLTDTLHFPETKNGKAHSIPVTPLIKEHLTSFNINHWSTQKDRLDKASGVTGFRLHDCRRTWATLAAECGIDTAVISRVLNHTPKGVTFVYNRYNYQKEMLHALLTVETRIKQIVGLC